MIVGVFELAVVEDFVVGTDDVAAGPAARDIEPVAIQVVSVAFVRRQIGARVVCPDQLARAVVVVRARAVDAAELRDPVEIV